VNHIFTTLVLAGTALLSVSGAAAQNPDPAQGKTAQSQYPTSQSQKERGGSAVTVTGCLAAGDSANEYSIKDASGKTFALKSSRVNLKPHVGHQVSVTGTTMKEDESKEKHEGAAAKAEEREHLQVTDLKMVSTSCQ